MFLMLLLFTSCRSQENAQPHQKGVKGEFIYRNHDDSFFAIHEIKAEKRPQYPWEKPLSSPHPIITKDFFRCKGDVLHPSKMIQNDKETLRFHDCGGYQKHSLPLRDGREFIYPILIDLLNYIQNKTQKKVIITSGHSCPDHVVYLDPSKPQHTSKHTIGAEVDFYVETLENEPKKILELIFNFYRENSKYNGLKDYENFTRYEKDQGTSLQPWMNKEVFVRIFRKNEGRDFDNSHSFPYLSIQVRYDFDKKERVQYSWDQAFKNYYRY